MKGENGSIPAFARDILQTLEGAGHEAYCVGPQKLRLVGRGHGRSSGRTSVFSVLSTCPVFVSRSILPF